MSFCQECNSSSVFYSSKGTAQKHNSARSSAWLCSCVSTPGTHYMSLLLVLVDWNGIQTFVCLRRRERSSVGPCINVLLMAPLLSEGMKHRKAFQPKCVHEYHSNRTAGMEMRLEPFLMCCVSSEPPRLRGGDADGCSLPKACDWHLLHLSAFHFHTCLSATPSPSPWASVMLAVMEKSGKSL